MMNSEESGMLTLPRPVSISWVGDLLSPAVIELIAWVLSTICARADTASVPSAIRQTAGITSVDKKLRRVRSLWRRISLRLIGIFAKNWDKQRVKLDCWVGNVCIETPPTAPTAQIVSPYSGEWDSGYQTMGVVTGTQCTRHYLLMTSQVSDRIRVTYPGDCSILGAMNCGGNEVSLSR